MPGTGRTQGELMETLRAFALRLPGAEEGISCAGTAIERRTVQARKRAFLFLGTTDVRLKLQESLAEASDLATDRPDRWRVGAHGWVQATIDPREPPRLDLLERWVGESYRLVVLRQRAAPPPDSPG